MSDIIDRRVVLGGETRGRGIIGGSRAPLEWVGLLLSALLALPVFLSGPLNWARFGAGVLVLAVAFGMWTPFPGPLGGRSLAAVLTGELRFWVRRTREPVFVPGRRFTVPESVGVVRAADTELPDGTPMVVLRHTNPGRQHFYTAAFEMLGDSAGIEADWQFGESHEGWGRFLATMARQGSLIRTVQTVTRIVPYDTADHSKWVMDRLPAEVDSRLAQSYVELLDQVSGQTEQHRSWVVFRMPVSAAFTLQARRLGQADNGEVRLVTRQLAGLMQRAAGYGLALRPLSEARLSAVMRSLQDPDWPIDKLGGLTFDRAWLPLDQRHRRHVVVASQNGFWFSRTAVVPTDGMEPGRFAPDFLHPLLSDVTPSVVRTISTVVDLVPVHVARSRAKNDVTLDKAASKEASRSVSDGSEEEQLNASTQRLRDLRPGTGHQGADWAMVITIGSPSVEELSIACQQVEDAAEEAHITHLRWLDGDHPAGLVASLPLGRGLEVRR